MKECEGRDTGIENGSLFSPGVPSVESVRIIAEYFYSGGLSHLSSRGGGGDRWLADYCRGGRV